MDLLVQNDSMVSVGEVAERIERAHSKRARLVPVVDSGEKKFDIEGARQLLLDVCSAWGALDTRGRRSFLVQLIDRIHIDAEGKGRIEWFFEN